ncbi:MAG: hypothetical protein ACRD6N_01060, partial [Pyrinomonadaceae bacterium]
MSRGRSHLIAALSILLIPGMAAAQSPQKDQPDPSRQKAFELLQSIAEKVSTLRAPSNRIQVGCMVADLLWQQDEKRARALFETLAKEISDAIGNVDLNDNQAYNSLSSIQQQRQQVIERLASHDPEMALSFLRATRIEFPAQSRRNSSFDNETNLELHLAALIAARNPELALRMALASLSRGVSYNQVNFLSQLQQKDLVAAQSFYGELVDRLAAEDMAQKEDAFNVGWNLIASFQPPQAKEQPFRQLIDTMSARVLAVSLADSARIQLAQNLYGQVRWRLALVEKYFPARAAALRQWSQAVERTFDANARMHNELNEVSMRGGVEDILSLAPRFPDDLQQSIFQQAIWKAINNGETERARQLVTELISNPVERRQMLDQIDSRALWKAASESKVAEVRQMLSTIKSIEQRVQLLTQLAANVAGKDKRGAVALVDEARG